MKPGYGGRRPRKPLVAALNLTPLIDVMIVMVCFLLLNFEAAGQVCGCGSDRIKRPLACMAGKLKRAPIVSVSPPSANDPDGVVTLEGAEVSTLAALLDDDSPDWKIVRLSEQLEVKKHNWRMTNPGKTFPGQVIVNADREVPFKALKKIVYSVGLAGYHELHFAVELEPRRDWP
jgi:biopolymer transport protein ExbD